MKRFIAFALLALSLCSYCFSQNDNHNLKLANKEFNYGNYLGALPYFIKLNENHPEIEIYYFKVGVSYLNIDDFANGLIYLEKYKAMVDETKLDKHFHFWYGRGLHLNGKFDQAIEEYTLYTVKNKKHQQIAEYDNLFIDQALVAKLLKANPISGAKITNLGESINSKYNEHNALVTNNWDKIYFTSDRPSSSEEPSQRKHYEKIFESSRVQYGNWSTPVLLSGLINEGGNIGSVELINNDSSMLIHKDSHYGDLFVTNIEGTTWGEPKSMDMINSWGVEDDAFETRDGRKIIFASDVHTQNGDLDLYEVHLNADGTWTEAKSLGEALNSEFDEDSPFLTEDGKTLYFSSNGRNSMGGFDIFKSTLSPDGSWGIPQNIGYPYNSPANDFNFYLDERKKFALISSEREGGFGLTDIYVIELK